jgi:hypothetical protein
MRRRIVCGFFVFSALVGCSDGASDEGQRPDAGGFQFEGGEPDARQLELCTDGPTDEDALRRLHGEVDNSVHELITCGGAQFSLMASLLPQILASNAHIAHRDHPNRRIVIA